MPNIDWNRFTRQTVLTSSLLVSTALLAEPDEDSAAWGAIQGQGALSTSSAWQWWMEAQGRFSDDADRLGQSLVRPGLGYQLTPHTSLWLGYAWVYTDPAGGQETDEHRIWQQLNWSQSNHFGKLFSRTRLEQRFLSHGDDTGWRFRELLKYTRPLGQNQLYLSLWDEVFINLNRTDWGAREGFAQNRLFAGLGILLDPKQHYRLEVGYLNQFLDLKNRNDRLNHIISASLLVRY